MDSIVSSNGQEDRAQVPTQPQSAEVVDKRGRILAIGDELCTALDFRRPAKSSPYLEEFVEQYRKVVPFIKKTW